jgi:anaerobic selenocysteine-containing dehydrogenase
VAPDTKALEAAWRGLRLTVQIATKLNRSHVIHGERQFLLPCLGRIERDRQASGDQAVTVEDATGCIYASVGNKRPASEYLLSEPKIVAELAKATLSPNPEIDWDAWVADYARIRDAIARTYLEIFHDFNERMWKPGGFHRPLAARHRIWNTKTGKANFIVPHALLKEVETAPEENVLHLFTLRSNDQFTSTIYSYDDRYRGVYGTRKVLLMNANDIARLRLSDGEMVTVSTEAHDQIRRQVRNMRVTQYEVPEGCCAGYYPECNPLIPWWHHAEGSKTPAAKSIPVTLEKGAVSNLTVSRISPTSSRCVLRQGANLLWRSCQPPKWSGILRRRQWHTKMKQDHPPSQRCMIDLAAFTTSLPSSMT